MRTLKFEHILLPLFFSTTAHLLAGMMIFILAGQMETTEKQNTINPTKVIQIEKASNELLKKLRTVGIKNGKKEFSTPRTVSSPRKNKQTKIKTNKINLSALATKKMKNYNIETSRTPRKKIVTRYNRLAASKMLRELSVSRSDAQALRNANFNLKFEAPEGVSEDELNSMEKIFYGFQKRAYQTYVSSFLHQYNEVITRKPYLKRHLTGGKHTMTGRITFDKKGNIISTKIIRWSVDDNLQQLFENTLHGIRAIYNPPRAMVEKDGEFKIYYKLVISG